MKFISSVALGLVLLASSVASVEAQPSPSPPASAAPAPSPSSSATASAAQTAVDIALARIDAMLRSGHSEASWFSASFLAQVPTSKVDEIVAGLKSSLGAYQSVEFTPPKFVAHFAKGTDDILIHLDADRKIDGLIFRPAVLASSLEDALAALRQSSSGNVSFVILQEGRSERAALNASAALAVGSTFKLAVLNALHDEIATGRLHWNDVVRLKREWKSLPGGVLQTWPTDTPLTLATLATEMISISDNTAADALVRIVGPAALARYAGANQPFLTTRELFTLKSTPGAELLSAYRKAATPSARQAVLNRVDSLGLPAADDLLKKPELDIEWHYSVRDVCTLMSRVSDLPMMSINPGVADAAAFRRVAYKGGSDTGIINLTTAVTTKRGTRFCFSATLNDSTRDVDELAFETAYNGVLHFLQDE